MCCCELALALATIEAEKAEKVTAPTAQSDHAISVHVSTAHSANPPAGFFISHGRRILGLRL